MGSNELIYKNVICILWTSVCMWKMTVTLYQPVRLHWVPIVGPPWFWWLQNRITHGSCPEDLTGWLGKGKWNNEVLKCDSGNRASKNGKASGITSGVCRGALYFLLSPLILFLKMLHVHMQDTALVITWLLTYSHSLWDWCPSDLGWADQNVRPK